MLSPPVADRLRPLLWPLVISLLALVMYGVRVRHEMVDFDVYRQAAVRVLHAEPLYQVSDGHYQFKYLPAFAVAMAPFGIWSQEVARAIWFAFSVGLLAAFVRWSIRALPERRLTDRSLVWLAVLFMAKFYAHELSLGQTNLLLGTLLVGALLAVQIDAPRVAGVLIGVSAFVKPYALILLPWLTFSYGLAPALAGLAVLMAGLVAPAAIYGWNGNLTLLANWWTTVTASTAPNLLGADNISLAAMWAKWMGPTRTAQVLALASAVGLLGLAAWTWQRRRKIAEPDYLEVALLMLLVPLLSPQGWDYVLLLATPAVLCLVDRWPHFARGWQVLVGTALVVMGLSLFDVMGRALYGRFMALSIVSVSAIALAIALAHLRWREVA